MRRRGQQTPLCRSSELDPDMNTQQGTIWLTTPAEP